MDNGLSASDALLLGNGGMGLGNGLEGLIYLAVIAAMFGGGNFGFGGNNNLQADMNRGFDNQNLQAQTRDILSAVTDGTAQGVSATNQTFHDSLAATQNLYNELQRDIAQLQVGQANALANQNQCCCETKQLIQQVNYDGAMRDAATNANLTAQVQSVKDMIAQDKIEALQQKVNELQMAQALGNVVRYPSSTTYSLPSPCFNCCS